MKKEYRVHVPAVIALDVAAESEEQAKRIAAAAVYTPASNLIESTDAETIDALHGAGVYVWSDGEGCSGVLDGSRAEVVDQQEATEEQIIRLTKAIEQLALLMGNEAELEDALASSQTETPTDEPCPVCFREEDGKWFAPCPSDDCPSHDEVTK